MNAPRRMSPSNVYLNEICERIRLGKVFEELGIKEGEENKSVPKPSDPEQVKFLGRTLSLSLLTLVDFADDSAFIPASNLLLLSAYHTHLPLSWFTSDLLSATTHLGNGALAVPDVGTLASLTTLWSVWVRRLRIAGAEPKERQIHEVVGLMRRCLETVRDERVTRNCWVGIGACTGLAHGALDSVLSTALTHSLSSHPPDTPIVDATVSHFLRITNNKEALETLWRAHLTFWWRATRLSAEAARLTRAAEAVLAGRVKDEREACEKRGRKEVTEKPGKKEGRVMGPADAMELLFTTIERWQEDGNREEGNGDARWKNTVAMLAAGGLIRAVQMNTPIGHADRWRQLRESSEDFLTKWLGNMDQSNSEEDDEFNAVTCFIAGECVPHMLQSSILKLHAALIPHLVSFLIHNRHAFNNGRFLRVEDTALLGELIKSEMFREVVRVSRAVARLVQEGGLKGKRVAVGSILKRMLAFSHTLLDEWDQSPHSVQTIYPVESSDAKLSPDAPLTQDSLVWQILKTVLFSFTAILHAVTSNQTSGPVGKKILPLLDVLATADQDVLAIYVNLHFITTRLSLFTAYKDTVAAAAAHLRDRPDELNKWISQAFHACAPGHQHRLVFLLNLAEPLAKLLDDSVLERDVLPLLYPYLTSSVNSELFESAHMFVLAVFAAKKPIAKELSSVYAKIIIEGYPTLLTIDQLRTAYTSMIQSLVSTDDALAWLTVQHLMLKIESLSPSSSLETLSDPDDRNLLVRSHLLITLVDQLRPLSAVGFFRTLLARIHELVVAEPNSMARQVVMKGVFEAIAGASGEGLSEVGKVEGVKWFLNLNKEVEKKGAMDVIDSLRGDK
ncbi:hypothetical protein BC937DRAFT_87655 [Endogone sp. FLAS-F59071]|nr:hypothetical protein BC937DRAFT_87655 [Endogone sp. FLAS-F59071]|eukprot:RUS19331.1 hypothetical protein BC937DRAFT_87655 [Endogone sp. FLAS-F59071]